MPQCAVEIREHLLYSPYKKCTVSQEARFWEQCASDTVLSGSYSLCSLTHFHQVTNWFLVSVFVMGSETNAHECLLILVTTMKADYASFFFDD